MHLLPPLVHAIRREVETWRELGYDGASRTTRALIRWWFQREHIMPQADGTAERFRWYFAQREAVESAIWLYEVARARDPHGLMRFEFERRGVKEHVPRRLDTLRAETRHRRRQNQGHGAVDDLELFSQALRGGERAFDNFLVVAPNIIVLDRLCLDFEGVRIFFADPLLPDNGHEGQNWQDDFQFTVHVQDESAMRETGQSLPVQHSSGLRGNGECAVDRGRRYHGLFSRPKPLTQNDRQQSRSCG